MDCSKIGQLIRAFRLEKGLTQKEIADRLHITSKTISKWECGQGCPDVSLWSDLSEILGVDMVQLMEGEISTNSPDKGNIHKMGFHVCPSCLNSITATGSASIFCCGRKLEPLIPVEDSHKPKISIEKIDIDLYISFEHAMMRDHYILFAAHVKQDRVIFTRLYPEQSPELRIPNISGGYLYLYCTKHGLYTYKVEDYLSA